MTDRARVLSPVELLPPLPDGDAAAERARLPRGRGRRAIPTTPFLITHEEELSYAEVDRRVDRAAAAWAALGVGKGDRVAFMLENSADFVVAWLGLAKLGAILVGLNTRWKPLEVAEALWRTRPMLALADGEHLDTVRAAGVVEPLTLAGLPRVGPRPRTAAFERPPLESTDPISFIFTSGTTGYPKAVMQTHGAYVLTGQAYPWWLGLEPGSRLYACLPLLHVNAQAYSTMGAIGLGGGLVLVERFSASRFWDDVRTYRASAFNFIGAVIAILLKAEPGPHERDHELRVMYGAPAFPEPERADDRGAVRRPGDLRLRDERDDVRPDRGAVRRAALRARWARRGSIPIPPSSTRPASSTRRARASRPGVTGELIIRNPAIMRGYFDDPERTAEALRDGWLWTGDLARRDEDGFFYYVDRKKDIIRRRGENVSSLEVEVVLTAHPAVEEAAVVGVPSELTEEEILALVQLLPGASAEPAELAAWCRERLADFKVPRYVQLVDALPKTATGRLQKGRMREALADPGAVVGRGGTMTRVLLLPGDCIGPEITAEARRVLERLAPDVELDERLFGAAAIRAVGDAAPVRDARGGARVDRRPEGPDRGSRVRRRRRPSGAGSARPPQGARRLHEPAARARPRDRPARRARARRRALLRGEGHAGRRHRLRHVRVPPRPGGADRAARVRARPHAAAERRLGRQGERDGDLEDVAPGRDGPRGRVSRRRRSSTCWSTTRRCSSSARRSSST